MKKATVSTIIVFTALIASGGMWSQNAQDLFQKALTLEWEVGNLQEAIDLYEKAIETARDQALAARAQLRIGICYEKLGLQEARKAFQKVIENYPQQLAEVKEARERISRLAPVSGKIPSKPNFRKIQIAANPGNGVLSPDGKRLAFASEGSVWVVPIPGKVDPDIAGTPVRLTEPMGAENGMNTLAWSGDGRWIAFNTFTHSQNSICVVPSSGGEVKKIPVEATGNVFRRRLSLSPDGKILAFCSSLEGRVGIFSVSVEGGKIHRLTDSPSLGDLQIAFSPDGKRLAYVQASRSKIGYQSGLWVIDLPGGTPVKLGDYIGSIPIRGPVWSPDGTMISFIRRHRNTEFPENQELCIVPVKQLASGSIKSAIIELLSQKIAFLHPAGWTTQNSIGLHLENPPEGAIYTVPASGGRATQISPAGSVNHPRWSPDGRRIFYRSGTGISSIPSDGGPVTSLIPHIPFSEQIWEATAGGGNNVSSDGKRLVFSGVKSVGKRGEKDFHIELRIFTLPLDGGQQRQITDFPWDPDIASQDRFPCWSPDGKWIAFTRDVLNEKTNWWGYHIFIVPSEGGEARQITSESQRVSYAAIDWSPDGKYIAYFTQDNTIDLLPVEGGPSKTLVKVDGISSQWELSWSPDGERIAYSSKGKIYTVQVGGGQPTEVATGLDAEADNLSWSPDGRRIAFAACKNNPAELYLVEDFLHLLKDVRE